MDDRLPEAKALIADAQAMDDDGFPILNKFDSDKFNRKAAFQLFYWMVARIEALVELVAVKDKLIDGYRDALKETRNAH